jgi:hypothetical protein
MASIKAAANQLAATPNSGTVLVLHGREGWLSG